MEKKEKKVISQGACEQLQEVTSWVSFLGGFVVVNCIVVSFLTGEMVVMCS